MIARPMSLAVFAKTMRDELLILLAASFALILFQFIFAAAMSEIAPDALEFWRRFDFLKRMIEAMFHVDLDGAISTNVFIAIGLAHPMLLTLTFGCVVASCTRVITGEVERGTADLLLALPIARWRIYVSVTCAWMVTSLALCLATWFGIAIAGWVGNSPEPKDLWRFGVVVANLYLLLLAIGAITMCVSSFFARRPVAVGACVGLLVFSYLLGFLEPFFPPVRYVHYLSFINYYQPAELIRAGVMPLGRTLGLLGIFLAFWLTGLWRFQTRDVN